MSYDISVVTMVDALPVRALTLYEDGDPRIIRLDGSGFNEADQVRINEILVDDFTLVSDRTLLFALPDSLSDTPLSGMAATVASSRVTYRRKVRLSFAIPDHTKKLSGIQKLVQQVVKELLSGHLLAALGGIGGSSAVAQAQAALSVAVTSVQEKFVRVQSRERRLSASERLLSLSVESVTEGQDGALEASLRLVTYAGTDLSLPLEL